MDSGEVHNEDPHNQIPDSAVIVMGGGFEQPGNEIIL